MVRQRARSWAGIALTALTMATSAVSGCSSPGGDTKASAEPATSASAKPLNLPGIDTDALSPREKREFTAQVREILAPCADVPVNLEQCLAENRKCGACKPATEMLLRMVQKGVPKAEREEALKARFDPKMKKNLDVAGSPFKGPEDAAVTVVEWADFECPFCKMMVPVMESLVERFPGQVRVVYKFYPISSHKNGEPTARAAIAAMEQGKFWEAHKYLFDHQGQLEAADLEKMANELKLDVPKWKQDTTSDATSSMLKKDREMADGLGLEGTPMIYIEGRNVPLEQLADPWTDLEAWVSLEMQMKNVKPVDKPAGFKGPEMGGDPHGAPTPEQIEELMKQLAAAGSGAPSAGPAPSSAPSGAPSAGPPPKTSASASAPPKK